MESQFNVYSVYDIKALRYGPLFEASNNEVASRQFVQMLSGVKELFRPEYKLFLIGFFDYVSGELVQNEKPIEVPVVYNIQKLGENK